MLMGCVERGRGQNAGAAKERGAEEVGRGTGSLWLQSSVQFVERVRELRRIAILRCRVRGDGEGGEGEEQQQKSRLR